MSESTRLGRARGKMLPVAIVAAALVALLALAPLASAAPDPVASGSTTLTLNSELQQEGQEGRHQDHGRQARQDQGHQGDLRGHRRRIEPTTGAGTLTHSGGLKITWGKKTVALKAFEVNTTSKSLTAKVGGKKIKLAKLAGVSVRPPRLRRQHHAPRSVKLTSAGANALNKALTPKPTKVQGQEERQDDRQDRQDRSRLQGEHGARQDRRPKSNRAPTTSWPTGTMTFAGDPTPVRQAGRRRRRSCRRSARPRVSRRRRSRSADQRRHHLAARHDRHGQQRRRPQAGPEPAPGHPSRPRSRSARSASTSRRKPPRSK